LVKTITYRDSEFDVVVLPLDRFDLHVTWKSGGRRLSEVQGAVRTNAGIFEPDFTPTGLLVSSGTELHPLESKAGKGNFYLQPNGVFAITDQGAKVMETSEYDAKGVREATQSGPLLVHRGKLHPKFTEGSQNLALRSGVGVRDPQTVILVVSRDDVNLWTFASLFRNELQCNDALYLDGVISALWAEGAGRDGDLDAKGPFAGVITVEPKRSQPKGD
jgi:uncharacterized protein YigE (DUF2233 family)